jgi:type III pantothenate kinase
VLELESERPPERHVLLVDQGNSRVKWVGAVWSALTAQWDVDLTTFGEGGAEDLDAALGTGELLPPEEILLCSVAGPERLRALQNVLDRGASAECVRLLAEEETCGIRNGYRQPETLGADRWMAVVGAARHHGLPCVVMDLGTGTTLDAIDPDGHHVGGLILPGPGSMLDALSDHTAIDFDVGIFNELKPGAVGKAQGDTRSALAAGIVSAQLGALTQLLTWFRGQIGDRNATVLKIIVTGGGAGAILKQSGYQLIHDPLLVFRGMLLSRHGMGKI